MAFVVSSSLYFSGIHNGKAHDTGAPAGTTNSPFDGASCGQTHCHNSNPLQAAKPWITSNVPVYGYTQDSIYTITAKAVDVGFGSFGFEVSPQTSGGAPLGTLIVTNSTATQIVTNGSLQYMTHTIHSYQGTDSVVWTFEWKAPAKGTGSVTFYGCFNCGNGNSSAANTFVFPATLTVIESATDGVGNLRSENASFSVFPNPAKQQINISYNLKQAANVEVNMYGMDGRKISNLLSNMVCEGNHTDNITLPSSINSGVYFIQLTSNGQSTVQKIIVE